VVAADVEPQEVEAFVQVHDFGLVLVEGQPSWCQPLDQPCLDLMCLFLAVAEHDEVVGVPHGHG
jgi:hypothetical protein